MGQTNIEVPWCIHLSHKRLQMVSLNLYIWLKQLKYYYEPFYHKSKLFQYLTLKIFHVLLDVTYCYSLSYWRCKFPMIRSVGRLIGWLVGWLAGWLVGWLVALLVGRLVGCSVGRSVMISEKDGKLHFHAPIGTLAFHSRDRVCHDAHRQRI